jgi:hypothetical protein
MSDEPDEPKHKPFLEIVGEKIGECMPERLREDERFAYVFGSLCGLAAGWIVGKRVIEWLFPKGDEK